MLLVSKKGGQKWVIVTDGGRIYHRQAEPKGNHHEEEISNDQERVGGEVPGGLLEVVVTIGH